MADPYRRKKEPKHIRLYDSIMRSEAWRHLSGNSVKVLIALIARDDGTRNGNIGFSCREAAAATGINARTAWRCLKELQEKGFIACTEKGGFSRKVQHSTLWRYTWQPWPGGKPSAPTRDFEKWKPDEKSRLKFLSATDVVSAQSLETPTSTDAESTTIELETDVVSADPVFAETTTLIVYQGDRPSQLETDQWKQANPTPRGDLGFLRDCTLAHLQRHEPGEQSKLAKAVAIPGGTFSKFINGGNLPEQYRASLADLLACEK